MNTEQEQTQEPAAPVKKKRKISIPFIILGVVLLAGLCPVGDIDGDGSMDVGGKWVMLKVMTSQENAKIGAPTLKNPTKRPEGLRLSGGGGIGGGGGGGGAAQRPESEDE